MSEELLSVLTRMRSLMLDDAALVRAVGSGRQRGRTPAWRRCEVRYVDLKAGRHLQVTTYDDTQAHTTNHALGDPAGAAVDGLLDEPFGTWHVETTTERHQVRVTKRLRALVHTTAHDGVAADRAHDHAHSHAHSHDRAKPRLLEPDDPVFRALGLADAAGRIKPSRQRKYRQVEEFLRLLDASVTDAVNKGHLRRPTADEPLRVVDLGCGNAYLTFAAQRYLTHVRDLPVRITGVDVRDQARDHVAKVAAELGVDVDFVVAPVLSATLDPVPEVALALHACDTATDEALARAVGWAAPVVLAAPCCHHDVAAQLRRAPAPAPYALLTRHGILRERFADTLTDALRAALLGGAGYRVDVTEFVESKHTPRNTMLRAVRTGPAPERPGSTEYDDLVAAWGVRPRLATLLGLDGVGDDMGDDIVGEDAHG